MYTNDQNQYMIQKFWDDESICVEPTNWKDEKSILKWNCLCDFTPA